MTTSSTSVIERRPRWPWVVLVVGLAWTALLRWPMVANAVDHLDSDLAVDGLTLLDMVHGRLHWHFPGTPYMGIAPILAAVPQALVWGATPVALVSGGAAIWLAVAASTFWLMYRSFGAGAACWGLLPLVCSSVGTLWLSSRITGGHLMTLAWHNLAIVGFVGVMRAGGWPGALGLGVWCGLGIDLDPMFLFTLAGLAAAAAPALLDRGRSRARAFLLVAFAAGFLMGVIPREIGRRVDPHDCYPAQFELTLNPWAVLEHARLLGFYALPRLISGIELQGLGRLAAQPDQAIAQLLNLAGGQGSRPPLPFSLSAELSSLALLTFFAVCLARVIRESIRPKDPASACASRAALAAALLIIPAFLLNKNVYNSDNYRYLVYLLTPWAIGFGLWFRDLASRGSARGVVAVAVASIFIEVMTSSVFHWYRDTRHYLDEGGLPTVVEHPPWSELDLGIHQGRRGGGAKPTGYSIPPDATHVMGSYWEVYRMGFLSGGKVTGVPYPMYPNRFPGWSRGLAPGLGKLVVFSPDQPPRFGFTTPADEPAPSVPRVGSARMIGWRPALVTLWLAEGRDPAEIDRLSVEVP